MLILKYDSISKMHFASKASYLLLCYRFQFLYVTILCIIRHHCNLYFSKKNNYYLNTILFLKWIWKVINWLQDKLIWEDRSDIEIHLGKWLMTRKEIINSMFPWKWTVNIQNLNDIVHLQFSALPPKTQFLCHYKHSCYLSSAIEK